MKFFRILACCALFASSLAANFPSGSEFSRPTTKTYQWVSFESANDSAQISSYLQILRKNSRFYLNLEYDALNVATGAIRHAGATLIALPYRIYAAPHGGRYYTRTNYTRMNTRDNHMSIDLQANEIRFIFHRVDASGEHTEINNFSINLSRNIGSHYNLLHKNEVVTKWKRYSLYTHPGARFQSAFGWISTMPKTTNPTISPEPQDYVFEDFLFEADNYRNNLYTMTNEDLVALTGDDIKESLRYDSLPEADKEQADLTIASLLLLIEALPSTEWDHRVNRWILQKDGSYQAGELTSGQYTFSADQPYNVDDATAPLQYNVQTATTTCSWKSAAEMSAWNAACSNTDIALALAYDPVESGTEHWQFDTTSTTWLHRTSNDQWHNTNPHQWTQTLSESDPANTLSFAWSFDVKANTWTNTTLGDVWQFTTNGVWLNTLNGQSWMQSGNNNWVYCDRPTITYTQTGPGTWLEDNAGETITWVWNTSANCPRGIWAQKGSAAHSFDLCSFNPVTGAWDNSGTTVYPPAQLPPFEVTTQNNIVSAHNSLQALGVL